MCKSQTCGALQTLNSTCPDASQPQTHMQSWQASYMPPLVLVSCEFYILGRRRVEGVKKKQWHHILVGGQRLVDGQ